MKRLEQVFTKERLLILLHNTLVRQKSCFDKSDFAPRGEPYITNQYTMLILMEAIIKYHILHKDHYQEDYFINTLCDSVATAATYKEVIYVVNQLLATSIKDKLGLSDVHSAENKRKILEYAYQNYIVEGYCFHSFPSYFYEEVKERGLYPRKNVFHYEDLVEVDTLFAKYGKKEMFGEKTKKDEEDFFYITDSPAMAYFYAIQAPEYLAHLTATGPIYKDFERYNINAYYLKDHDGCLRNLDNVTNEIGFRPMEKKKILDFFEETWNTLKLSTSFPCIAFLSRKEIGRDSLKDHDIIIEEAGTNDIITSLSRILDSRYPRDRRYSKVVPFQFEIVRFPSFRSLFYYQVPVKKETEEKAPVPASKKEAPKKEETKKVSSSKTPNNRGYADILAMTGFFLITLGLTAVLVLRYFGIG